MQFWVADGGVRLVEYPPRTFLVESNPAHEEFSFFARIIHNLAWPFKDRTWTANVKLSRRRRGDGSKNGTSRRSA